MMKKNNPINQRLLDKVSVYADKYFSTRLVFILDVLICMVSSLITVGMMALYRTDAPGLSYALQWVMSSTVISALTIFFTKSYRIIIRHSTVRDFGYLIATALIKDLLLMLLLCAVNDFSTGILIALTMDFCLTCILFVGFRAALIVCYEIITKKINTSSKRENILVFGISDKSISIITRLDKSPHYKIAGFLTYGENACYQEPGGIKVYNAYDIESLSSLVKKLNVTSILFSTEKDIRNLSQETFNCFSKLKLKTLLTPEIGSYSENKSNQIRQIKIEDLLGRDEIHISMKEILEEMKDKTIMVTGAAGSIGSELCRQLATFGIRKLVMYDNAESPLHAIRLELEDKFPDLNLVPIIGDVRMPRRLDMAFNIHHPEIVFHAAAYKHVPLMEENPCEAVYVNVCGSRNVADKCLEYGVEKMIMISTDKAVNPTNIMGCSKRLAEIYVQSLGLAVASGKITGKTKFITTRFGNVLGSNGSVIPRFRKQIAEGGPVTVTHPDITRFFMTIPEACRLVMEAATISTGNQILVFDMGKSVKIDDLAHKMIRLSGLEPGKDIAIKYVGLRPGEKLYEEVLSNKENTEPTSHDMIRIAKVRDYDYEEAKENVNRLYELSTGFKIPEMVKLMKEIVPEFISKNSRFEEFDKH